MKFPFSARLGAYLAVFGVVCELVIYRLGRLDYTYREPFDPLPVALLIAYGVALFIRPSVAQFWERDDLFERATRRGFIASASGTCEAAPGDSFTRISSRLRRQVPPKLYCLRLSTLALFLVYPLIILVTTCMLAEGYGRSWRANRIMGLRVYVAGPSGLMLPDLERGQERLLVKVTSEPEWLMDSKRISEKESRRIRRMPERFWRGRLRTIDHWKWYLNSKPMTQEKLQQALREELGRRRVRFVYLDVDHSAPFHVTVEAIEVVKQAPDTRVVLVTDGRAGSHCQSLGD